MIIKRFFLKIIFSLFLGILCAAYFIKHDRHFINLTHDFVAQIFKEKYQSDFCAESCEINPLSFSLTFNNVRVKSNDLDKKWTWSAQNIVFQFNPFFYFYNRSIQTYLTINSVELHSDVDNKNIAIQKHIMSFFERNDQSFPLVLKSIMLNDIDVFLKNDNDKYHAFMNFSSLISRKADSFFLTYITCVDGGISVDQNSFLESLQGSCDIAFDTKNQKITYSIDALCKSSQLSNESKKTLFLKVFWNGEEGSCSLYNQDKSINVYPCKIFKKNNEYHFSFQYFAYLNVLKNFFKIDGFDDLDGMCMGTLQGSNNGQMHGTCKLQDIFYAGYTLDMVKFSFIEMNKLLKGDLQIGWKKNIIDGFLTWSFINQEGSIAITNTSEIPLHGYWKLLPKNMNITGRFSKNKSDLRYKCSAYHTKTEEELFTSGIIEHKDNQLSIKGSLGLYMYQIYMDIFPFLLKKAIYFDDSKKELFSCICTKDNNFTASMDYQTVRAFARSWYDFFLPGQGVCKINGSFDDKNIYADVQLSDALIRLSGTYNFISSAKMKCHFDKIKKIIKCNDVYIGLHKGSIESKKITVRFPSNTIDWFIHMPINFHNCFINVKKYIYGSFSGSVLYKYEHLKSILFGFLSFNNLHVMGNIFTSDFYTEIHDFFTKETSLKNFSTSIGLHVNTYEPITVKTSVIDTKAKFNCMVKNTFEDPSFEGVFSLKGGKIKFPAHFLEITRGSITLVPHQKNDYILDIVAQRRIKKYLITLTISGSIQDPTLVFQASPDLSQEQIMMLLFSGTEEESLNVMAPALVMYNAQKFLFKDPHEEIIQKTFIPRWLQPFQRVSFLPRFTDQTGRGGLKGVLEVEFNDRLSASIEKNFSLSENAAVQIEYLLSDDVSLKLNKNDRNDMGAEVEMRFKF